MGERSEQKREYIISQARHVFAEKGFSKVTMKDIVDACDISRGGLYLYFDSTAKVFEAVLEAELKEAPGLLLEHPEEMYPSDLLMEFFKSIKKLILFKKDSLQRASYEYALEMKPHKKENLLYHSFQNATALLAEIIEAGVESGEFYAPDPEGTARNIMYTLEGLRIHAGIMGISEKTVDRELRYILEGMLYQEDSEEDPEMTGDENG